MSSGGPTTVRFEAAVPQFTVPDLVRTAEYYRDVLGFHINRADESEVRTGRARGAYDAYVRLIGVEALAAELGAREETSHGAPRRDSLVSQGSLSDLLTPGR